MNLYEFSEVNNQEIGIFITQEDDPILFQSMQDEVERLMKHSEEVSLSVQKVTKEEKKPEPVNTTAKAAPKPKAKTDEGFCIRCRTTLPHDPEHPYCRSCYNDWKKEGKDPQSPEMHCHWCGKSHKSTLEKPVDYDCYKKHLKPLGY